jgi:phage gp46-like protein
MSISAQYFLPADPAGSSPGSGRAAVTKPRRWIDPATHDYVVENGDFKQDEGSTSKVVLALATKKGSCQVLPWFGSRLHEIRFADERGRGLAETFAKQALAHLVGELVGLSIKASVVNQTAILLVIVWRRGTRPVRVQYTARVKG